MTMKTTNFCRDFYLTIKITIFAFGYELDKLFVL